MVFALAVFLVVLFVFAVDLVHRTLAALAGGPASSAIWP
jgi:hypothetical protein